MLCILLIDDMLKKVGCFRVVLFESGFEVVDELGLIIDLLVCVEVLCFDVILIDMEFFGCDVMEQVCLVSCDQLCLIVMFIDEYDLGVMCCVIQFGVSVYIVEGIQVSCL